MTLDYWARYSVDQGHFQPHSVFTPMSPADCIPVSFHVSLAHARPAEKGSLPVPEITDPVVVENP